MVVVAALYDLGGAAKTVDTEDVAVRANDLAPGRFCWRRYPQQIDLNAVLISLRHAKRAKNGALVSGDAAAGWRLTSGGRDKAKKLAADTVGRVRPSSGLTRDVERWARHERKRLTAESAFIKFRDGRTDDISATEALRFFNLDEYIRNNRRMNIIARVRHVFADDSDLGPAIRFLLGIIGGE